MSAASENAQRAMGRDVSGRGCGARQPQTVPPGACRRPVPPPSRPGRRPHRGRRVGGAQQVRAESFVPSPRTGSRTAATWAIRHPARSVIKWAFEAFSPRSTGFGPAGSPFQSPRVHRVDRAARSVRATARPRLVGDGRCGSAQDLGGAPPGEAPVCGRPRRSGDRLHLPPGAARRCREDDRGSTPLPPHRRDRHPAVAPERAGPPPWSGSHGSSGTKRPIIPTQRRLLDPPHGTPSGPMGSPDHVACSVASSERSFLIPSSATS